MATGKGENKGVFFIDVWYIRCDEWSHKQVKSGAGGNYAG
jgi:hypothetical protein